MEHPDLRVPRRVLVESYKRYVETDRQWIVAEYEAKSWFPAGSPPAIVYLGDIGSKVRRLHDARERALERLMFARAELERARRLRKIRRREDHGRVQILLLSER